MLQAAGKLVSTLRRARTRKNDKYCFDFFACGNFKIQNSPL